MKWLFMKFSILAIVGLLISSSAMARNNDGTFCKSLENHARNFGREFIDLNLKPIGGLSDMRRDELITIIIPNLIGLMKNLKCDLTLFKIVLDKTSCLKYRQAGIYPDLKC
jgi:hypothetical protein